MQTLCPNIRLGEDYARKLILKHELKWDDLVAIEDLVADAFCFREKAHHLTFMGYSSSREGRAYSLVLKAAARGTETWVVTLHRTNEQQIRSKVERARAANRLLRTLDHPFEE